MGDDAPPEKCARALGGAVDELIRHYHMTRRNFLAQAAHGADGYNPLDAEFLHAEDIRSKVHLSRQPAVAAPMARQKNHFGAAQFSLDKLIGRLTEGGFDFHLADVFQPFDLVEPGAADDPVNLRSHNVRLRLGRHHGPRPPFSLLLSL